MSSLTRRQILSGLTLLPLLTALPARSATLAVVIKGMKFNPATLQIAAGDSVTFTNEDGAPHTATADDKSWDTGRLSRGNAASITFAAPGRYAYHCAVHPSMKGVIIVA